MEGRPLEGESATEESCDVEGLADGVHRHVTGLGYRPSRHALLAELHDELRTHLPCHVDRSSFV